MENSELIGRARAVALEALKDRTRYDGTPFIGHPDAVARIVSEEIGLPEDCIAAVYLHEASRMATYEVKEAEWGSAVCTLVDGLNKIPGVYSPIPMGAFYTVAKLPVDDAEKFCIWCLSEFRHKGATIMMAPAAGFYTEPGEGRQEVRIAYVLNKTDLANALECLVKALELYPGRTV